MAKGKPAASGGRQHKATYATDKRNGGYLIRVQGPQANLFAGRDVPVTTKSGEEHSEKLIRVVWTGTDDGKVSGYVGPCALYTFAAKPRETEDDEIPF